MSAILIADDNARYLYLPRFFLKKDHAASEAGDGSRLSSRFRQGPSIIILKAIQIPGLHGLEVARIIKTKRPDQSATITARVLPGDEEQIKQADCIGFIKRPIDPGSNRYCCLLFNTLHKDIVNANLSR